MHIQQPWVDLIAGTDGESLMTGGQLGIRNGTAAVRRRQDCSKCSKTENKIKLNSCTAEKHKKHNTKLTTQHVNCTKGKVWSLGTSNQIVMVSCSAHAHSHTHNDLFKIFQM